MRLLIPCLCVLVLAACERRTNRAVVYDEVVPSGGFDENRAYALRLTLFQFGNEVGGMVEWFGIDGDVNTRTSPYFERDFCAYFGEGPIEASEFRVDTLGPADERLLLQVEESGRRALEARVVADGGMHFDPVDVRPLRWVETDRLPARSCLR